MKTSVKKNKVKKVSVGKMGPPGVYHIGIQLKLKVSMGKIDMPACV